MSKLKTLASRLEAFQRHDHAQGGTRAKCQACSSCEGLEEELAQINVVTRGLEVLAREISELRKLAEIQLSDDEVKSGSGWNDDDHSASTELDALRHQLFVPFFACLPDQVAKKDWCGWRCNLALETLLGLCFMPEVRGGANMLKMILYDSTSVNEEGEEESNGSTDEDVQSEDLVRKCNVRHWNTRQLPSIIRLCISTCITCMSRRYWRALLRIIQSSLHLGRSKSQAPNRSIQLEWWRAIVALFKHESIREGRSHASELMTDWFTSFRSQLIGHETGFEAMILSKEIRKAPAGLMAWIASMDDNAWRIAHLYDIPLLFALHRSSEGSGVIKEDVVLWLLELGDPQQQNQKEDGDKLCSDLQRLVEDILSIQDAQVVVRAVLQFCFYYPAGLSDRDQEKNRGDDSGDSDDSMRAPDKIAEKKRKGKQNAHSDRRQLTVDSLINFAAWYFSRDFIHPTSGKAVLPTDEMIRSLKVQVAALPTHPFATQPNQATAKDMAAVAYFLDNACAFCQAISDVCRSNGAFARDQAIPACFSPLSGWFANVVRNTFRLPLDVKQVDRLCICVAMLPTCELVSPGAPASFLPAIQACYSLSVDVVQTGAMRFLVRGVIVGSNSAGRWQADKMRSQCLEALLWHFRRSLRGQEVVCSSINQYIGCDAAPSIACFQELTEEIQQLLWRGFCSRDNCSEMSQLSSGWLQNAFCGKTGKREANFGCLISALARLENIGIDGNCLGGLASKSRPPSGVLLSRLVEILQASFFSLIDDATSAKKQLQIAAGSGSRAENYHQPIQNSFSLETLKVFPFLKEQICRQRLEAPFNIDDGFAAAAFRKRLPSPIVVQTALDLGAACALLHASRGNSSSACTLFSKLGHLITASLQSVDLPLRHEQTMLTAGLKGQISSQQDFLCKHIDQCDWPAKVYALSVLCRPDLTAAEPQQYMECLRALSCVLNAFFRQQRRDVQGQTADALVELTLLGALERYLQLPIVDTALISSLLADALKQAAPVPAAKLYLQLGKSLCSKVSLYDTSDSSDSSDSFSLVAMLIKKYAAVLCLLLELRPIGSAIGHEQERDISLLAAATTGSKGSEVRKRVSNQHQAQADESSWETAAVTVAHSVLDVLATAKAPFTQGLFDVLAAVVLAPRHFHRLDNATIEVGSALLALPQQAHLARSARLVLEAYSIVLQPGRRAPKLGEAAVANICADLELLVNDGFFTQDAAKRQRNLFVDLVASVAEQLHLLPDLSKTTRDAAQRLANAVSGLDLAEAIPEKQKVDVRYNFEKSLSSFRALGLQYTYNGADHKRARSVAFPSGSSASFTTKIGQRRRRRYRKPLQPALRPDSAPTLGVSRSVRRRSDNKFIDEALQDAALAGDSDGYEDLEDFIVNDDNPAFIK